MDVIDRFLKYLEAELNLSPNTVGAYGRDLRLAPRTARRRRHHLRHPVMARPAKQSGMRSRYFAPESAIPQVIL